MISFLELIVKLRLVPLIRDSISIMDQAGMSLSKWCSNSSSVADLLEHEFDNKFLTADTVKVLGMRWLAEADCFTFDCIGLPEGLVITKRVILNHISRVFDPLGFLTLFTMMSKCLFQELWKTSWLGWGNSCWVCETVPDVDEWL